MLAVNFRGKVSQEMYSSVYSSTMVGKLVLNSLPAKSVLAGTKLVLFGRYVLKFYVGIVQ